MAPLEAFCLDVDGTMYSIRAMLRRHFLSFMSFGKFFKTLHKVRDEMRGMDPVEDFRREQARRLAGEIGTSQRDAEQMVEDIIDKKWMAMFPQISPFFALRESLSCLLSMGFKLAVLSDYPAWPKLGGMGLAGLNFSALVNAEEIGALKPHPAPFEHVVKLLGVPAGKIMYVGDLERNDVDGALGAGMLAARFYQGRRPETKAQFAFKDWRQFIPLLRWKGLIP